MKGLPMRCLSKNVSNWLDLIELFPMGQSFRRHSFGNCRSVTHTQSIAGLICRPAVSTSRRISRYGVAAIEFALVAPFILFIIFGAVEFARMMMVKQALTSAAREGCRHATLATTLASEDSDTFVRQILIPTVSNSHDSGIVKINIVPSFSAKPESGSVIVMAIEVDCSDITWLPEMFLCGAKIRGSASMSRE
tara:strand:- start:3029 stop:3607 length:579 start_codon:yes stop_codon:yes gene_type:complete